MQNLRKGLPLLLLLIFTGKGVFGHPHVFIDYAVKFVFDDQGLAGFEVVWVFDDLSSAGYILDYDKNRDNRFSSAELKALKRGAFDNLKSYNYMTFVSIDRNEFKVSFIKDFSARVSDSQLVYQFFIPCHVRAISNNKVIRFSMYDEEYFVDYSLKPKHIYLQNSAQHTTSVKYQKNFKKKIYFGQINPMEIELNFKEK